MRSSSYRAPYDAPQSEIIDCQIESSFMNGTTTASYSGTYCLGDSKVVDDDTLLD